MDYFEPLGKLNERFTSEASLTILVFQTITKLPPSTAPVSQALGGSTVRIF
jgi:hypothetical protein